MPKAVLACALAALALPSHAQQSIPLGKGAGEEMLSYAVQDASGATYTVRTVLTYTTPQTVADIRNVMETVSIEKIDCARKTHRPVRYQLYTSLQPNAAPVLDLNISSENSKDIPVDTNADSAAAMVVRAVCQIQKPGPMVASNSNGTATASQTPPAPQPAQSTSSPTSTLPANPPSQPNASVGNTAGSIANNASTPAAKPPSASVGQPGQAATPVATSSIASARPFQDSAFTIGILGKLAEYVYYDETKLALDEAVLDKMSRGRQQTAADGKQHPILDEAWNRLNRKAGEERAGMQEKQSFLSSAQLVPIPLPKTAHTPVKAFRAELYRYGPDGETVLVFRGTESGLDWLTNLWLGVDYRSSDAPHYQAAYDLVSALQKQNIKPLVVGHSLGAGLAQYVGYKFGLKVVGFNSSPLPARYFAAGLGANAKFVRLFSAVETDVNPATMQVELAPDPVSLDVPNIDAYLRQHLPHYSPIAANLHLAKPDCIQSAPTPLFTEREQQTFNAAARDALSSGVVSALLGGKASKTGLFVSDELVKQDIKAAINGELSKPIWMPDSNRTFDKDASNEVKKEIIQVALDSYGDLGAVVSIVKGGYNLTQDDWKTNASGLGTFVKIAAKAALYEFLVRHLLMPHSIERFNRGIGQLAGAEVFQNLPEQVRAQCETQSTYY